MLQMHQVTVLKVNVSKWNQPVKTSSSVSIPLKGGKTFAEMQKKVEALKSQIIEERSQRHTLAQQFSNFRHESEKDLQHKKRVWENKFRDLQKEKYNLSMRLQKLEIDSPKQRLAEGGDVVHLTDEDIKRLRQEIEEQESLIRGYQVENERATDSLREVQRRAKEREQTLTDQNVALASQLASLQASSSLKMSNEDAYASLTESLTLRAEILNAQAREAALILEIEKLKDAKRILKDKVADFEKVMKVQIRESKDTSDVSCQCHLLFNFDSGFLLSDNSTCKEQTGHTECHEVQIHEEKENLVQNLQVKVDEKEVTKVQNLQKRMENLRRAYDLKIRDLKQQVEKKSRASQDREGATMRRVKELEAQISDIRSFYTKKLKEQAEKALTNSTKKPEGRACSSKSDRMSDLSTVQALKLSQKRVTLLDQSLREKEAIIKHLEENLTATVREGDKISRTGSLNGHVEDETSPSFPRKGPGEREQPLLAVPDPSSNTQTKAVMISSSNKDIQSLRMGPDNVSHSAMEMEPPNKLNSLAASLEHQADFRTPVTTDTPISNVPERRIRKAFITGSLAQEMAMPQSQQLQALQEKVLLMESRQKHRELEWQALMIETKRLLNEERDMAEKKWQLTMEAKNAEIERFKLELDAILETAIQMQRAQLKKA